MTQCVKISTDVFAQHYICLQAYCTSGKQATHCERLQIQFHQNKFPKEIVYDIDVNEINFNDMKQIIFSTNIGERLNYYHDNELDYSRNRLSLGAFMIGLQDRHVAWYIMAKKELPTTECSYDVSCLLSQETQEGAISFGTIDLGEGKFYVCARSEAESRQRKDFVENFDKVEGCSDGFIIDETRPSLGTVKINSNSGYISDSSELLITWNGFYDNSDSYGPEVLQYRYAIGMELSFFLLKMCYPRFTFAVSRT